MISAEDAIVIAREAFPEGPEVLVERLNVHVEYRPLGGCDGFCVASRERAVIFLNKTDVSSAKRLRFTLAHELAHLILGIPSIVGENLTDMLSSDDADERRVNEFAAELLVPASVVTTLITEIPVVAQSLVRLAKKANVSDVSAALRVADLADGLGLSRASVIHFDRSGIRWQWTRTERVPSAKAAMLLNRAQESAPHAFRFDEGDGTTTVAAVIENGFFDTATLLVQRLPSGKAQNVTSDERRKQLEELLFGDDEQLSRSMTGYVGALKNRMTGRTADQVEADFWQRYEQTLNSTRMNSAEGREYIRLRISQWY
ncbi:MAG TPA: ImmA/IrrE family metallo-endopeptidase [Planctomycetaceae bacterium]|nr:ImmA/IrrE family metallo-endopeptidase [Planctomycetaceae bacterium]